jgi:hypothetical protein
MSEEAIRQPDATAAPTDDSADGQGGTAETVAPAPGVVETALADESTVDASAAQETRGEASVPDLLQQAVPSTSNAVPNATSTSHVDTEATSNDAPRTPASEPAVEAAQLASAAVADADLLAVPSNELSTPIVEPQVEADQTSGRISQQDTEQLTVETGAVDPVSTAQAPTAEAAMTSADQDAVTDVIVVEPSVAEVEIIVTHADSETEIGIDRVSEVVQPVSLPVSTIEDVPPSSQVCYFTHILMKQKHA